MAKRGKLLERIENSPNNVTFRQLENVLLQQGFVLDRVAGSPHVFVRGSVSFVVSVHGKKVKSVYVRRVVEILEKEEQ